MYERAKTSVRTVEGDTNLLAVEVGLHQGSTLSWPFLFAIVIDELTRKVREDAMVYAIC